MAVRTTMAQLIAQIRLMIGDPEGTTSQFFDPTIQDMLDQERDDIRYESLTIAPSIVNTASTGNQASTIFADYYSAYSWWESDVILQGYFNGAAWVVLNPVASDYIVGHWQFELTPFVNGTVPGQLPPIFATGKVYDLNRTAANLLELWAATLTSAYNFTSDGQSFQRSQMMQAKLTLALAYRRQAKPKIAKMQRNDILPNISSMDMRLLDAPDMVKGA